MAEEHRPQAPRLCVNNCGFFGSPATQNLCSRCFRDSQLKEQQSSSAKLAFNQTLPSPPFSSSASAAAAAADDSASSPSPPANSPPEEKKKVETAVASRCATCRKRVGLTGFKCRCGMTYCGSHRYAEAHGCEFDFKSMDRDAIAKANPVVKADKLRKI